MKKILCLIMFLNLIICGCNDNKPSQVKNQYDFLLKGVDENGLIKEFSLKDFEGQNLIIYFGYGLCPDVCPAAMSIVADVLDEQISLKHLSQNDVKMIFISIDPKRDEAKQMNDFVKYFYQNSQALIPTEKQLEELAKVYGVRYEIIPLPDSELKYSVAHSSSIYIFDKNGNFKGEISNLIHKKIVNKLKEFGILKN